MARRGQAFADYDPRNQEDRWKQIARDLFARDRFGVWAVAAGNASLPVAKRKNGRPDIVLASFPPAATAMVAGAIHAGPGIPYVLDFRDRWIGPGGYAPILGSARRRHLALERMVIAGAAGIVAVSDAMAEAIVAEQGIAREKVVVVPNGFEEHDGDAGVESNAADSARGSATARRNNRAEITIAHVGTVIPRNRPDLFFDSLIRLRDSDSLGGVRFRFVGNLSAEYLRDVGLDKCVETTGLVPRAEARREMRSADALLLLTGNYVGQWGYNAKLFEYLRSGRPILCLEETPGSNDRKLLEEVAGERAFFALVDDAAEILAALGRVREYAVQHGDERAAVSAGLAAYSRRALTGTLAEALERFVSA
jgi:glycosyltransferase involved in cell wall biosynthesis